ncbi:MAG: TMEM143 family protein [Planctomycetota bacterium]
MKEPTATQKEAAQPPARTHFIPFRKVDVVRMCLEDGAAGARDAKGFAEFAEVLAALFHYEYHERLETLKDSFAPFNPDAETRAAAHASASERDEAERRLLAMLREVLTQANFREMSREEIRILLEADPGFKMRLEVDLDDYAELLVFRRGRRTARETVKSFMGLRSREVEVALYDRVVVYLRFKGDEHFKAKGRRPLGFTPGGASLKLFQNVPENGLEMLFPNARMKMRLVDKLMLAVPAALGSVGVLTKLSGPLLVVIGVIGVWLGLGGEEPQIGSKQLVALALGVFALVMFANRQLSKIKSRRLKYLKYLSENLYFKVLDNSAGVLHHLIDAAEEEDVKEAILAYHFILTRKRDFTEAELDREVERWFRDGHATELDFEVDDAMRKLVRLELASVERGKLRVLPPEEAKARIDWLWDNVFSYNPK